MTTYLVLPFFLFNRKLCSIRDFSQKGGVSPLFVSAAPAGAKVYGKNQRKSAEGDCACLPCRAGGRLCPFCFEKLALTVVGAFFYMLYSLSWDISVNVPRAYCPLYTDTGRNKKEKKGSGRSLRRQAVLDSGRISF